MAASWHRILLLSTLVILAAVAGWLGYSYPGVVQDLQAQAGQKGKVKNVGGSDVLTPEAIAAQEDQWKNPARWTVTEGEGTLFTSRLWLYFTETKKVELSDGNVQIDGVPLAWLMKNNLDARDPEILNEDPDGDGFTNREEFTLKTDPGDPKAHPSYATLLRLQSSMSKKFVLTFSGVNDLGGEKVFQINTPQGRKGSYNVKAGDHFEGFTVGEYRPKRGPKKMGNLSVDDADISELDLKSDATGESVVLVYHDAFDAPEISASFILLLPNAYQQPITVAQGKEFTLQATPKPEIPAEALHFRFLSADPTGAKLLNPDTKETITVPLLKPEELQRFATPATDPNAPVATAPPA